MPTTAETEIRLVSLAVKSKKNSIAIIAIIVRYDFSTQKFISKA